MAFLLGCQPEGWLTVWGLGLYDRAAANKQRQSLSPVLSPTPVRHLLMRARRALGGFCGPTRWLAHITDQVFNRYDQQAVHLGEIFQVG